MVASAPAIAISAIGCSSESSNQRVIGELCLAVIFQTKEFRFWRSAPEQPVWPERQSNSIQANAANRAARFLITSLWVKWLIAGRSGCKCLMPDSWKTELAIQSTLYFQES